VSPDHINAIGAAVAVVLGAIFTGISARQSRRVSELQEKVDDLEARATKLEEDLESRNRMFREAIRYIRRLLHWTDEADLAHRRGDAALPSVPPLPELLGEEV
jgi:type VI protein secretion system component VasK